MQHRRRRHQPKALPLQTAFKEDAIGLWLKDCCETAPDAFTSVTSLYQSYRAWCAATGEETLAMRKFSPLLEQRGFKKDRTPGKGNMRFAGLKLKAV